MGQNDTDKKLLPHDLRNAFRKAISRVSNQKIAVRPRSLQCWAIKRSTFLGIILSLIFAIPAFSQANRPSAFGAGSAATAPDPILAAFESSQRRYLLGDWGGKRTSLAEKGVTFDFFYISDMQANPSGGRQQTQAGWERARGTIDINSIVSSRGRASVFTLRDSGSQVSTWGQRLEPLPIRVIS